MPQGLQVFDASGNVVLDTGSRVTRILGIVAYSGANGSVTDANFALGAPFWYFPSAGGTTSVPAISFNSSTNTLSWTWNSPFGGGTLGNILYGVY